jgi:hypothetical protein
MFVGVNQFETLSSQLTQTQGPWFFVAVFNTPLWLYFLLPFCGQAHILGGNLTVTLIQKNCLPSGVIY